MEREVTLMEMLDMRESRAKRQQELLAQYSAVLISFSMNIAGPVNNSPLIRRGFREGLFRLEEGLRGASMKLIHREQVDCVTGCEAMLMVAGDGEAVKKLCVELEDEDSLGRLFDLDVLEPGRSWSREQLGLPPRRCLICGAEGKGCASRRLHSVQELRERPEPFFLTTLCRRTGRMLRPWRCVHCSTRWQRPEAGPCGLCQQRKPPGYGPVHVPGQCHRSDPLLPPYRKRARKNGRSRRLPD